MHAGRVSTEMRLGGGFFPYSRRPKPQRASIKKERLRLTGKENELSGNSQASRARRPSGTTLAGYRHPNIKGWKELATTSPDKIREMASNGYSGCNWVSVAKDGFACIIDIDDVEYAKSIGMPIPWDTFIVNTPSGGLHLYLWHTEESAELGNTNILGPDGSPAVEFKANNLTCASPGVLRSDKEPHGYYAPANDNEIQPISKELVEFLRTHGKQKKQYTAVRQSVSSTPATSLRTRSSTKTGR